MLSVLVLGAVGTALAFVIFYKLINEVGAGRASLVSYLAPGVALFYGALLLDEAITAAAIAGLVLILAGVALASRPAARSALQEALHRALLLGIVHDEAGPSVGQRDPARGLEHARVRGRRRSAPRRRARAATGRPCRTARRAVRPS